MKMNTAFRLSILFMLFLALFVSSPVKAADIEPLNIGDSAPDFNLPGVDGKTWSLKDFEDADILTIIFTCNHCPTAQAYEDRIINLVSDFKDKGVAFVAISPNSPKALALQECSYSDLNDDFEAMKIRAESKDFNFPYLYDGETQAASKAYGPQTTPHVFVFDEERKLRYRGRIDDTENPYKEPENQDTRETLKALLNDQPVPRKTTPTFGCSIKWESKKDWVQRLNQQWAEKPVELEIIVLQSVKELINQPSDNLRLFNFWATWCGPCVIEFPELVKIHRIYQNRDFELVTVSTDRARHEDKVLDFLKEKDAAVTNYLYKPDNIYDLIDTVGHGWNGSIPFSLLISPEGKVLARYKGVIDPLTVKRDIIGYLGRFYADDE